MSLYPGVFILVFSFFLHKKRRDIVISCRSWRALRRNPADLHSETIRFLPFSRRFFSDMANEGRGRCKTGRARASEWASGSRHGNWKEKDRQGGTWPESVTVGAFSLVLSFPFCYLLSRPLSFSFSRLVCLLHERVVRFRLLAVLGVRALSRRMLKSKWNICGNIPTILRQHRS